MAAQCCYRVGYISLTQSFSTIPENINTSHTYIRKLDTLGYISDALKCPYNFNYFDVIGLKCYRIRCNNAKERPLDSSRSFKVITLGTTALTIGERAGCSRGDNLPVLLLKSLHLQLLIRPVHGKNNQV